MNLSSISVKVVATSLLLASTTGLAFAKHYRGDGNYKGEANYKGEVAAVPCPAPITLKDGFYIGAQAGYDSYRIRTSVSDPIDGVFANPVLNATGWVGGLFIGYGQYLSDLFYLGGEIFGNVSGAESTFGISSPGDTINSKFEANGSYGLSIIPGIKLNDTSLGYVKLGWNWANLKASASDTDGDFSGSDSHTSNGFNFGLGIETLVYDAWSIRTEFNHTYYSNFNTNGADGGVSFKPSDNQFMLGVLYHFT